MDSPIIRSKRLTIRVVQERDVPGIFEIYKNDEVCKYFDMDRMRSVEEARQSVHRWIELRAEKRQYRYAICLDDAVIGTCGVYGVYWHQFRCSLGYDLNKNYWGKGYMTEALEVFIPYLFAEYNMNRVQATVIQQNLASIKVLKRSGFRFEGILRDYEFWGTKGFVNLAMYSRKKGDD